ncbi:MAG: hypothetical protein MSS47_06330 [Bacteroidales bacterium]|nr:hypothetical protein [Bacteroidales bacterium]
MKHKEKEQLPDELLARAMAQADSDSAPVRPASAGTPDDSQDDVPADGTPAEGPAEGPTDAKDNAPTDRKTRRRQRRKEREERARETIKRLTDIDDEEEHFTLSMRTLAGGDIFGSRFFHRQIGYLLLLTLLAVIYVTNRYACQREEIEREKLCDILSDRQFKAFTAQSELTEYSMQSNIEANLADTTLQANVRPRLLLPVDSLADEE